MATDIRKKIEYINDGLKWIKRYRSDLYERLFLQIVDKRRRLLTVEDVEKDNPAIAAYGISQVGKSYLMSCILQKDGKSFQLDAEGKVYDFIKEMNPQTDETEATGVVTRFSTFTKCPERFSPEHPIMMRCLSVTDLVLVIADGYFKDTVDSQTFGEAELTKMAEDIYNKYIGMPENPSSPLQPDNVLDMAAYVKKQFSKEAQAINRAEFLQTVALVADRIPSADWAEVFSILWVKNPYQTKLLKRLLETLAKIRYSKFVYLPPQALLHEGKAENTVMSVQCLNQLFMDKPLYFTKVFLRDAAGAFTTIDGLTKSEVCAVCAEIVVKIGNEYLDNASRYCMTDIKPEVRSRLTQGEIHMDILRNNDMLDFPGARSRLTLPVASMKEDPVLLQTLLRGKVAYLFNNYNETNRINILIYCHNQKKNEVTLIPLLLKDWILNNVGRTMKQRENTMRRAGLSPLFYIGTMFNLDMRPNNPVAPDERWEQRFTKVLYKECFSADSTVDDEDVKIFLNWSRTGEPFSNSYLVRDFKFSGPDGNQLYTPEPDDAAQMMMGRDYYENMRETFVKSDHVKQFFPDPELSWDVTASVNNTGALYVIENLAKVAPRMDETRKAILKDIVDDSTRTVYDLLDTFYEPSDEADILAKNIASAHCIFRELEFTCEDDPEFFGHMIQDLQLTESQSYNEVHSLIPTLGQVIHNTGGSPDYERIRTRCNNFEGCKTEDDRWNVLLAAYHFKTREEAIDYFERRKINILEVIKPSGQLLEKRKSVIIANHIMKMWNNKINSPAFVGLYSGPDKIDDVTLSNLLDCVASTANSIHLMDLIAESISPYVDNLNANSIDEALVADLVATTISDFVTDFGFRHLEEAKITKARRTAEAEQLSCFDWIDRDRKEFYDEPEITALFDRILDSSKRFTPAYDANFNTWLEYMYIAFIAHIGKPDVDIEANSSLGKILTGLEN